MKRNKKNRTAKSSTIGYVQTSVSEQIIMNQKLEILEYCRTHGLCVDKWIEVEVFQQSLNQKRIRELLNLPEDSVLVSTEISKLGKSSSEIIGLVNQLLRNKIRIIFTKEDLDLNLSSLGGVNVKTILTIFSTLAQLERNIISLRTREALLTKKGRGFSIGKARGTVQRSIYDSKKEQILLLLSKKISVLDISRIIGIGKPRSLLIYLNKRKLREEKKSRK